jgi:hypothetical protein
MRPVRKVDYGGSNHRKREKGRVGSIEKPKSGEDHCDQACGG